VDGTVTQSAPASAQSGIASGTFYGMVQRYNATTATLDDNTF
jgi:hypothetical protein